ncbi:MAG: PVC-type heme-binding CxxCH protein [Verrucomicrobiota bacterium]
MLFPVKRSALIRGALVLLSSTLFATAGELAKPAANEKKSDSPNDAELLIKGFQLQPGYKAELFAAEPFLANTVAFTIDNQNNFYVAETYRLHAGVTDIRGHRDWLDEDLASRTTDDRIAMMKRHEGGNFLSYEQNSERIKKIWDKDGDGKADGSSVFAENFKTALDGIAAGVLEHNGKVYFANIPNLWELADTNHDNVADERRSLSFGYGVRVGFLGHDLHGLIIGPDGRLYFSIGDRGSSVEVNGKRIGDPDAGSVFRCTRDGTGLEVFAWGLRNPQELAFDQYGNLFTGDNNSDSGDRARLVYLVQGGTSGWNAGFQWLERPNPRGPWNSEKMWHPQSEGQPAFIIPPIANLTDGPSGFAFYPGTGLTEKYDRHFFLCDFHGSRSSGIWSFTLETKGAGFELANQEKFIWNCLPTDVTFGPEPGIYFADWVQGWGMTGKGRIYHVFAPEAEEAAKKSDTTELLENGMKKRSVSELSKLLAHADMRVRQEAQFELVNRGGKGESALAKAAQKSDSQLARLHGVWGLGQLARAADESHKAPYAKIFKSLLSDKDPEVRAQTAKVVGDSGIQSLAPQLIPLLSGESERARVQAAIALGVMKEGSAIQPLFGMLREANDKDPIQRHAASYALSLIGDMDALEAAAKDPSPAVRMGVLLAMRRLHRVEIAQFLHDQDAAIVAEAARAINDLQISAAIPELANLYKDYKNKKAANELYRRITNANYRYGTAETARTLSEIANNDSWPEQVRAEALYDLGDWVNPSGRDNITGLWRPVVGARSEKDAREAIEPQIAKLITNAPEAVRSAAAELAARLQIRSAGESLLASLRSDAPAKVKLEDLRALAALDDARLGDAIQIAQNDKNENLRKEALRFESKMKPSNAIEQIANKLRDGTVGEKQGALGTLAAMKDPAADQLLNSWMDKLMKGEVAKELQLDVLDAASKRNNPDLKAKLAAYEAKVAKGDQLEPYRVALYGGNKEEGRKIFFERPEAACVRCHKIKGDTTEGGEVGPELTHVGSRQNRDYILESIVLPNKKIAEGFQTLIVTTKDGTAYAGIVKAENNSELILNSPEDGIVTIKKADITTRQQGQSSMPEGLAAILSKQDLRNLVEYLAELK